MMCCGDSVDDMQRQWQWQDRLEVVVSVVMVVLIDTDVVDVFSGLPSV